VLQGGVVLKSEIELRKDLSRLTRESRAAAKLEACYICNKSVSSFCKKLEYINYLIFRYTESFCVFKGIRNLLMDNENIRKLCRDTGDVSNLGMLTITDFFQLYEPVKQNEIPNILSAEYELTR